MEWLTMNIGVEDLDFVESMVAGHDDIKGGGDCVPYWHELDAEYAEWTIAMYLDPKVKIGDASTWDVFDTPQFSDLYAYAEGLVLGFPKYRGDEPVIDDDDDDDDYEMPF